MERSFYNLKRREEWNQMMLKKEQEYKIPVITYVKDETKRHFFFYFFPGVFIDAGWYSEQQAQLDAMKKLLTIQQNLIINGCINK